MTLDLISVRSLFPRMPREVFDLWLIDRIKTNGWPPAGKEWAGFLCEHSIEYWQRLSWTKQAVDLASQQIAHPSSLAVANLAQAFRTRTPNVVTSYVGDSFERFTRMNHYVHQHGQLPGDVILIEEMPGSYNVVDGCHRMAVFLVTKTMIPVRPLSAWVGRQLPDAR
jgi:hypothetical protein